MDGMKPNRRPEIKGLFDDPPTWGQRKDNFTRRGRKPSSNTGELTPKQRSFIREYMIDQNASGAARRAGYSERTAKNQGLELLKHRVISAEIKRILADKLQQAELSSQGVLSKLKALTTGDIRDIFDPDGNLLHPARMPESIITRIASIKVVTKSRPSVIKGEPAKIEYVHEIKLWGMDSALTNLAKAFAMFTDKPSGDVQITIRGGLPDDDFGDVDIVSDSSPSDTKESPP